LAPARTVTEDGFVDLYRSADQMEAMLIRMVLDGTDIRYYIANENMNRVLPMPGADMLLRVERQRAAEAAQLLTEAGLKAVQSGPWRR
jgi:hypothetical protein